jgi:hypothetical protein
MLPCHVFAVSSKCFFIDILEKMEGWLWKKGPEARHSVWPGVKAYTMYAEYQAKHYNAAYGTFYGAILFEGS